MRKLHLVGVTSDQKGLIFSGRRGSKSGGYVVPIEDELIDAIADAHRTINGEEPAQLAALLDQQDAAARPPRPESTLTPREMQARLRAGRSIVEVAAEARVGTEWVERFAIPILAEQAKMVELARSLSFSKQRLGESSAPLARSVAQNLADRGVRLPDDVFDSAWTAYQLHDTVWVVRFRYRSRGRLQEAAWELDTEAGTLASRNRLGSELGYVEARRRRTRDRAPSAPEPDGDAEPLTARPTSKATAKPTTKPKARSTRKSTTRSTTTRKAGPASKATARPASKATARPASKATTRPTTKATRSTAKSTAGPRRKATTSPTARTTKSTTGPTTRSGAKRGPARSPRPGAERGPARSTRRAAKKATTASPRSTKPAAALRSKPEPAPASARRRGSTARATAISVPPPPAPVELEFELEEPPAPRVPLMPIADETDSDRPGQASDGRPVIAAQPASEVAREGFDASGEPGPVPPRRVRRSLRFGPAPAG